MEANEAIKKLMKMKDFVAQATRELDQVTGSLNTFMEQLEKNHACKTIEEAVKKLNDLNSRISKKEEALVSGVQNLEEKYDWN